MMFAPKMSDPRPMVGPILFLLCLTLGVLVFVVTPCDDVSCDDVDNGDNLEVRGGLKQLKLLLHDPHSNSVHRFPYRVCL